MVFINNELKITYLHNPKCGGIYISNLLKKYYGFYEATKNIHMHYYKFLYGDQSLVREVAKLPDVSRTVIEYIKSDGDISCPLENIYEKFDDTTKTQQSIGSASNGCKFFAPLYCKKNNYGIGVYAAKYIPKNTIIIQESPIKLDNNKYNSYDYDYIFKMIYKLLQEYPNEFENLSPNMVDEYMYIDDEIINKYNSNMFSNLSNKQLKLYYFKYLRNNFQHTNISCMLFYATKINHSCDPNILYYYKNDYFEFITLRPIKENEELYYSYINLDITYSQDRQNILLENYGFYCECNKCNAERSIATGRIDNNMDKHTIRKFGKYRFFLYTSRY